MVETKNMFASFCRASQAVQTARGAALLSSSASPQANVSFLGLGNMGAHMARNLIKAGHSLTVYDINAAAMDELISGGAKAKASSPKTAVTAETDVIITMLPS